MRPPEPRSYTPAEFRRIMVTLFGDAEDWELAAIVAPHFFTTQRTVYRWLTGTRPIVGPAAVVVYWLQKDNEHG